MQQKLNKQKTKQNAKEKKNVQRTKPNIDIPPGFTGQLERQATQISDFWNVKMAGTETDKTPEFKV